MNSKSAKILWWVILVFEAVLLAAMLLGDFGVVSLKTDIFSFRGIVYHAVAVILIVTAVRNLRKL